MILAFHFSLLRPLYFDPSGPVTRMHANTAKQALRQLVPQVLSQVSIASMLNRHAASLNEIDSRIRRASPDHQPVLIALGKMAEGLASEWINRLPGIDWQGMVCSPYLSNRSSEGGLRRFRGGHPVPNPESLQSASFALQLVRSLDETDVVVFLVSGGGSASFELPDDRLGLSDLRATYDLLVGCGAGISEINTVRTYLSQVKGGRLAVAAFPAQQFTLAVSDVPQDNLSWIASGPTIYDTSDLEELHRIVAAYGLLEQLPDAAKAVLKTARPTPKPDWPEFTASDWRCIGSNADALAAAGQACTRNGWDFEIATECDESTADDAAETLLRRLAASRSDRPFCLIAGGEVRTIVRGNGTGGRNQEFVMECIPRIAGRKMAVISFGTDGLDGNSRATGAVAAGDSMDRCHQRGLDLPAIQADSNATHLFEQLDDLIITGPTGINVRDVRLLLKW